MFIPLSVNAWKIFVILIGIVLLFVGIQEARLAMGASFLPLDVDLVKLESGESVRDKHARIGRCVAIYDACVISYEKKRGQSKPASDNKVNYCFYPIVSEQHPLAKLVTKNADAAMEDFEIEKCAVLVKSDVYKTIGKIPQGFTRLESIEGMFVNSISSLNSEERELITGALPGLDTTRIQILEQGRKPTSFGYILAYCAGGVIFFAGGIAWLFERPDDDS